MIALDTSSRGCRSRTRLVRMSRKVPCHGGAAPPPHEGFRCSAAAEPRVHLLAPPSRDTIRNDDRDLAKDLRMTSALPRRTALRGGGAVAFVGLSAAALKLPFFGVEGATVDSASCVGTDI